MTATKYTYSISGDTLNGIVDSSRLTQDIQSAAITIALDRIDTSGDVLDIWFKTAITEGEETVLDAVVAAHTGEPLPGTTEITTVQDDHDITVTRRFQPKQFEYQIAATQGWQSFYRQFVLAYDVINTFAIIKAENIGDKVEMLFNPGTTVGTLSESATAGDNHLHVTTNAYFSAMVRRGFYIEISTERFECIDLVRESETIYRVDLGKAIKIYGEAALVLASSYAQGTSVKCTMPMISNFDVSDPGYDLECEGRCGIGEIAYGSSGIPEGSVLLLKYYNADGAAKTFRLTFEGYIGKSS